MDGFRQSSSVAFGLWFPCSGLDIIALSNGAYLPSGMSKVLEYKYVVPILPCQQKSIPLVVVDYTFMEVELLFIVIIILIDWAIEKWSCGVSPLFFHAITNQEKGDWLIWIIIGARRVREVSSCLSSNREHKRCLLLLEKSQKERSNTNVIYKCISYFKQTRITTQDRPRKASWDLYHSTFLFYTDIHIRKKDQEPTKESFLELTSYSTPTSI